MWPHKHENPGGSPKRPVRAYSSLKSGPVKARKVIPGNYFLSAGAASAGAAGAAAAPSAGAAGAAPSAGAAAGASAGAAGASAAGGGVAAGSVLAASCFAQAVSISAATSALRASFVFIDRYPERSKSGEKTIRTSLLSFRESLVRIAAPNSIESRGDWKQPLRLSRMHDKAPGCFCALVRHSMPPVPQLGSSK